jgi:hypothetical protein
MWLLNLPVDVLYNNLGSQTSVKLIPMKLTIDFDQNKIQKNWMPFFHQNRLMLIYSVNPHVILFCDTNTGRCIKEYESFNDLMPKNVRGGSAAILKHWNGISFYVAVTHIQKANKRYVTQFYAFEPEPPFKVIGISDDFVFSDAKEEVPPKIQFASGLEFLEGQAIITYGENDCSSNVCKIQEEKFFGAIKFFPLVSK